MTPNYWNTSVIGASIWRQRLRPGLLDPTPAIVVRAPIKRPSERFFVINQALCAINGSLICHINYGEVFRFNPLPFQYPSPSPVLQPLSFSSSGAMPLKGSWGKQVLNVEEASVGHGVVMNT